MQPIIMKNALIAQYRGTLKMIDNTIDKCPDDLWTDAGYPSPYWQIVYHALHYTAFYLSRNEENFLPWRDHHPGIHQLGKLSDQAPVYTKTDMKEFIDQIGLSLEKQVNEQSLEEGCGFDWLSMTKFELHIYNLRHLQHHTGQLIERLHQVGISGIGWVRSA